MREIKFRAWDTDKKKMFNDVEGSNLTKKPINLNAFFRNDDFVWMQYTGLKDKKDKEIYEGDIILSKYFDDGIDKYVKRKAEVIFEDGCFQIKKESWQPLLVSIIDKEKSWTVEVIGNIYENPELKPKA